MPVISKTISSLSRLRVTLSPRFLFINALARGDRNEIFPPGNVRFIDTHYLKYLGLSGRFIFKCGGCTEPYFILVAVL